MHRFSSAALGYLHEGMVCLSAPGCIDGMGAANHREREKEDDSPTGDLKGLNQDTGKPEGIALPKNIERGMTANIKPERSNAVAFRTLSSRSSV